VVTDGGNEPLASARRAELISELRNYTATQLAPALLSSLWRVRQTILWLKLTVRHMYVHCRSIVSVDRLYIWKYVGLIQWNVSLNILSLQELITFKIIALFFHLILSHYIFLTS
jgi:hypothetical protein